MRRRSLAVLAALLMVFQPSVHGQTTPRSLFATYNLSTPTIAATANRIVTSVAFANGTLTLAAQPDTPRNLTATLTDADVSCSGTFTITGTDVDGNVITDVPSATTLRATFTGTKVYASVTSVIITGASGCTGADVVVVGVGSTVSPIYCSVSPNPIQGAALIKTSGTSTTVTEQTASTNPFTDVQVGDELTVQTNTGGNQIRYVATRASAASITVRAAGNADSGQPAQPDAVNWANGTSGSSFTYKRQTCGYNSGNGWVTPGYAKTVAISMPQVTATGGVVMSIECRFSGITAPLQVYSATFSTFTWPQNQDTIPIGENCTQLRVGLRFGTNDDASDTVTEKISVTLTTEAVK